MIHFPLIPCTYKHIQVTVMKSEISERATGSEQAPLHAPWGDFRWWRRWRSSRSLLRRRWRWRRGGDGDGDGGGGDGDEDDLDPFAWRAFKTGSRREEWASWKNGWRNKRGRENRAYFESKLYQYHGPFHSWYSLPENWS